MPKAGWCRFPLSGCWTWDSCGRIMTKARCSCLPITCEGGRQLFDLRLYCRPASALLLCLAAILLLDVGMVAITALRAGVSGRKLSNGANNMYDLHDHWFMVASALQEWTWSGCDWAAALRTNASC